MELKKILKIVASQLYFIAAIVILGAVIGAQSAKFFPSGYSKSQLFFLAGPQDVTSAQNNYFTPYFAQENARNFTDTAVAILGSEEFLKEALPQGPSASIQKVAPQLIRISTRSHDASDLDEPLAKFPQIYNQKISALSQSTAASRLSAVSLPTAATYFALNRPILASVGAILGLFASFLVIGLKVYLKL